MFLLVKVIRGKKTHKKQKYQTKIVFLVGLCPIFVSVSLPFLSLIPHRVLKGVKMLRTDKNFNKDLIRKLKQKPCLKNTVSVFVKGLLQQVFLVNLFDMEHLQKLNQK